MLSPGFDAITEQVPATVLDKTLPEIAHPPVLPEATLYVTDTDDGTLPPEDDNVEVTPLLL